MIGLNKIGLNQVQLNRLRLNAPFPAYGKMAGGGGSGDGFPQLPGDVTRWHFGGLTNEMMAAMDDPRIEDVDHKGRFLSFKNFAWSGMSGCGGYSLSKETFSYTPDIYSFNFTDPEGGLKIFDVYFQLIGLEENSGVTFNLDIIESGTAKRIKRETYTKDGIYHFEYKSEDDAVRLYMIGYNGVGEDRTTFTVKILPYYAGALVFDGVDDYGICENFPILTKEKGYTVVALRQWIEEKNDSTALVSNCKNWGQDGAFLFEYNNLRINFLNVAISFGHVSSVDRGKSPFSYQTSKLYNGKNIEPGSFIGSNELVVGKGNKDFPTVSKVAIWELIILDHDATEEELTKIKNYFVKTYPWLFFDQAWTVTGKTNEDEDRATIANITGNGNDLVLSNFGFAEGSGYNEQGEYAGYLVTDGVDDMITSSAFQMGKDFTIVGDWKFIDNKKSGTGLVKGSSFYIYNTMIGLDLYINSGSVKNSLGGIKSINAACSDGRVYDPNWDEILANTGNVVGSGGMLEVSSNGRFDRIAFKNLAIYPRILSKDDCIKAYNYLQTLKAK